MDIRTEEQARQLVAAYRPQCANLRAYWPRVRHAVGPAMVQTAPAVKAPSRLLLATLIWFAGWLLDAGLWDGDQPLPITPRLVDGFRAANPAGHTAGTMKVRVCYLRAAGRLVTPRAWPSPAVWPAPATVTVYDDDDIGTMWRHTNTLADPWRHPTLMWLSLGLGAGATRADIVPGPTCGDVTVHDDQPATVTLSGWRPRTVPLLEPWSSLVAAVAASSPPDVPLVGFGADHHPDLAANKFRKTEAPRPVTSRMRATWIAGHLADGTAIGDLLAWSGLRWSSLPRYLPLLPSDVAADVRRRWQTEGRL